jgi:hypothetical protein
MDHFPVHHVAALIVGATLGFGVLELLFDAVDYLIALLALEGSELEFGFHFGGTGHGTVDRDEFSELERLKVSDLGNIVHVVNTELENRFLVRLMSHRLADLLDQLGNGLPEVGLVAHVLAGHAVLVFGIRELELLNMPEIDEEGRLLIFDHILSFATIVENFLLDAVRITGILLVVGVARAQFVAVL